MNNRDIKLADIRLQHAWCHLEEVWPELHPNDPKPFLSQVFRTKEMQDAYYAQGRKSLAEVNAIRRTAGLGPLLPNENLHKVTFAPSGKSKHEKMPAQAFDIAFVKAGTKTQLDYSPRLFMQAAAIIKKFDPQIEWGGSWKKQDQPHFQV